MRPCAAILDSLDVLQLDASGCKSCCTTRQRAFFNGPLQPSPSSVMAQAPSARLHPCKKPVAHLSKTARTAVSPRFCEPLVLRAILTNARRTDETSRSESGDPVCRPIRLLLFRLSFHLDLRCQASQERCSGRSRRRGTIISGRFRDDKLVGSSRFSKCFFAVFATRICLTRMPLS